MTYFPVSVKLVKILPTKVGLSVEIIDPVLVGIFDNLPCLFLINRAAFPDSGQTHIAHTKV